MLIQGKNYIITKCESRGLQTTIEIKTRTIGFSTRTSNNRRRIINT